MPQSLDDFLPKKQFQLSGGEVLSIGVIWDQDSCRQLVLIQFLSADSSCPTTEIAVSAESADTIIAALQDSANQARFINGKPTYVYPPPVREVLPAQREMAKAQGKKTRKPNQSLQRNAGAGLAISDEASPSHRASSSEKTACAQPPRG